MHPLIEPSLPPVRDAVALAQTDIEEIVKAWQERLRLTHWNIDYKWGVDFDDADVLAEIESMDMYDYATLKISAGFEKWTRHFANLTVVHELLHLPARDMGQAVVSVQPILTKQAWTVFEARYTFEIEQMIDRMAHVLVELVGDV